MGQSPSPSAPVAGCAVVAWSRAAVVDALAVCVTGGSAAALAFAGAPAARDAANASDAATASESDNASTIRAGISAASMELVVRGPAAHHDAAVAAIRDRGPWDLEHAALLPAEPLEQAEASAQQHVDRVRGLRRLVHAVARAAHFPDVADALAGLAHDLLAFELAQPDHSGFLPASGSRAT